MQPRNQGFLKFLLETFHAEKLEKAMGTRLGQMTVTDIYIYISGVEPTLLMIEIRHTASKTFDC